MFRRIQKLRDDTRMLTDAAAAIKFLDALETDEYFHFQLVSALFDRFGDTYTLNQVYETAERLELAHVHYATMHSKAYASYKGMFSQKGRHASPAVTLGASTSKQPAGKTVKTAAVAEHTGGIRCNYCANPDHISPNCNCPKESLYCTVCNKTGHVSAVCLTLRYGNKSAEQKAKETSKDGGGTVGTATASKAKSQKHKGPRKTMASAKTEKASTPEATVEAVTNQVQNLSVASTASSEGRVSEVLTASTGGYYGYPYHVFVAQMELTSDSFIKPAPAKESLSVLTDLPTVGWERRL